MMVIIMKQKDILLLRELRKNARQSLTSISQKTNIPVSTVFDRLKMQEQHLIQRHTSLIDFSRLGYSTRATVTLKVHKEDRAKAQDLLMLHSHVNTMYKINNGYDFQVEAVFKNFKELEYFIEELEEQIRVKAKQVYYIIEDIKKEEFFTRPECGQV